MRDGTRQSGVSGHDPENEQAPMDRRRVVRVHHVCNIGVQLMTDGTSIDAKLDKLAALSEGWDGYGCVPVDERAVKILQSVDLSPMSDGGIMLELWGGVVSIEIGADGSLQDLSFSQTVAELGI